MGTFIQHFRVTKYMAQQGENKRLLKGWSKKQLANNMRVSLDTVRRLESGNVECRQNTVFEWARQLETTVTRLHDGPDFDAPEMTDTTVAFQNLNILISAKPHRAANTYPAFRAAHIRPRFLAHRTASLWQWIKNRVGLCR
ncbi:helix-turn-helix transcriptional regulator [bacterium]|nr:helix-turn-helix transcriptional regulator [bacterium]